MVCSKQSPTANNTDLYLTQYEQLRYLFSSLGVRGTPILIQVNMCKCRVVCEGETVMEILAYVLYSQCSVALLSIVDHAS